MPSRTDGILLIDKDQGEFSYEVVRKVKSAFEPLQVRKVGHAGTLDPFATGLLIILLGQGTKLSPFITHESKVYLATLRLGIETDTLDPTGRVIRENAVPEFSLRFIEEKARSFTGEIEQKPPVYSAVKYGGTRAYKLARRGQDVVLRNKKVVIHSLNIISVALPEVTMMVKCSSGTYIRSLAADLGSELGPGAHLRSLRRLACGPFKVKDGLKCSIILGKNNAHELLERVIPLRAALPDMLEIEAKHSLAEKVRHGYQPLIDEIDDDLDVTRASDGYVKLVWGSELVAVMKVNSSRRGGHAGLKIARVFS